MNDPDERPDNGGAVPGLTPSAGVRVLRAIRIPGILLLIGFALTVVGPFPAWGPSSSSVRAWSPSSSA